MTTGASLTFAHSLIPGSHTEFIMVCVSRKGKECTTQSVLNTGSET